MGTSDQSHTSEISVVSAIEKMWIPSPKAVCSAVTSPYFNYGRPTA